MAVTKQQVAELYVATFNRAPDAAGLDYWVNTSGLTIEEIAQSFFDQPETQALYPDGNSNTDFVTSVYTNLFNRAPDADGLAYWVAELDNDTMTRSVMLEAMKNGALDTDATIIANKATVALAYADAGLEGTDFSLASVTEVAATMDAALAEVTGMTTGSSFTLTSGNDTFLGTAASDTFTTTEANLEGDSDIIVDSSSVDNDVLNIIGTTFSSSIDTTGATVRGIENVNVTFDSLAASTFDARGITTASTITVNQARAGSGATITVDQVADGSTVKAGTDVNNLTVTTSVADKSVIVDAQAATGTISATVSGTGTVSVTADSATSVTAISATTTAVNADAATTIAVTGKTTTVNSGAEATITATGTAATTDTLTVAAAADVTIANQAVNYETITVSATEAVVATITTTAATTYTGNANVTFSGNESMFDGKTVTGAAGLELTTVAASDLSKVSAATIIDVAAAAAGAIALSVNDNANLDLSSDVGGILTLNGDDDSATTYLDGTINLTLSENITTAAVAVTNHAASTDGFSTININVTKAQTGFVLTGGSADVIVTGSKALVLGAASTAGSVDASAMTAALTATANGTLLDIISGAGADSITVATTSTSSDVSTGAGNDTISVGVAAAGTINGGDGTDTLTLTGAVDLSAATITSVEILNLATNNVTVDESFVNGQAVVVNSTGAITVDNIMASLDLSSLSFASTATTVVDFSTNLDSTLGTSSNFTVTGSSNADVITTGNGTNTVNAGAGNDTITGGTSVDTIIGGAGNDTITAGGGNDVVQGDAGTDSIDGGAGNDTLTGGEGTDTITGGTGADTIILTETTSVADTVVYASVLDGSAVGVAAGTFTGYDVITGFTVGTDFIDVDTTSSILTLAGDIQVAAMTAATTASNDLTAADFANVNKLVSFLNDGGYTDPSAGTASTSVVAVTYGTFTAIYAIDNDATTAVAAGEITLLGTVDAVLTATELI